MWETRANLGLVLFITGCVMGLAVLIAGANTRRPQDAAEKIHTKGSLTILKKVQADSPVTIASVVVDNSLDGRMPRINFVITNNTTEGILAYTIMHEITGEAVLNKRSVSGSVIEHYPDPKQALQPGQSVGLGISGIQYPKPPESIILSVDFVEFISGIRWGPDTLNNSDRIDGLRAGVEAERNALTYILTTEGVEGVTRSLDSAIPKAEQAEPRSAQWRDG